SSTLQIVIETRVRTDYRVASSAALALDAATGPGPLFDLSAGDAVARVPGGIGFIVVIAGMDHDRRSVVIEQAGRIALDQRDQGVEHLERESAAVRDVNVGHAAGVRSLIAEEAVGRAVGVEGSASRFAWRRAWPRRLSVER